MTKNKKTRHKKSILAVASAGGHWTQLLLLSEAFQHCDVHYVSTKLNLSALETHKNVSVVNDADLSNKFKLLPLCLQIAVLVIKKHPDVIISTGAAPGFFAILFGKLIGAKTIWIDSMANYSHLSISGKYASKVCDLCLTQWPDLATNPKIKHTGSLL